MRNSKILEDGERVIVPTILMDGASAQSSATADEWHRAALSLAWKDNATKADIMAAVRAQRGTPKPVASGGTALDAYYDAAAERLSEAWRR